MEGQLEKQLKEYLEKKQVPLHMPGHKRRISVTSAIDSRLDFTEIEETDDLHHAHGILQEAMARTSDMYGSKRTWYLVNGSTCGCLAGIFAAAHEGAEVIAARNCHRSVYHAMQLRHLHVHWLMPSFLSDYEVCGSLSPNAVKDALAKYPHSEAVILTSPTYEGVISDIHAISEAAHKHHIPVFVDEAHGAHLGFGDFPQNALQEGADLIVQSPHKTLFSATGTAWLHLRGSLIKEEEVEKWLGVFETSSPSYPLMMSLDGCTKAWQEHQTEYTGTWFHNLHLFEEETASLQHIHVLNHPSAQREEIFRFDPSKLLIHNPLSGTELMRILHDQYHFTMEMAEGHNVLAMTSAADDPDDIVRFARALTEIDRSLKEDQPAVPYHPLPLPEVRMSIHDAVEQRHVSVSFEEACGLTAGEYVFLYPPGIPLIVPGEIIAEEQLSYLARARQLGYEIRTSASADGTLAVVR